MLTKILLQKTDIKALVIVSLEFMQNKDFGLSGEET